MLAVATWVDNILSFAPSADAAVSILCDFEADLSRHWGLRWKPASRMVMSARGCPTGLSSRLADLGWAEVTSFCALGAVVMDNGAPWEDLSDCKSKMWQKFFGSVGRKEARGIRWQARINALDRVVRPALSFRAPGWSLGGKVRAVIDRLRRRMAACCVWVLRSEGEDTIEFWKRKAAIVSPLIKKRWSIHAAERVISWSRHLKRDHVPGFASALLRLRGLTWLEERRAGAHKLGQRVTGGMPPLRWEEGARHAAQVLHVLPDEF